ncbi:class I SAM-dependent RNA methyltransferase [Candidatus Uabimicrobium sp. HlEnr_7]|uniref:THUMP domain-containing class I SAM-dependent RNA methyltransferase n=1 Tax=Candidatus Uabimicrobium helgolandensis TaxID=3095367 RepID=UPI0035565400
MENFQMHATTLSGLEELLAKELTELGAKKVETQKRLVTFEGDKELLYRANLWCRTAIRILKPIDLFSAYSEKELYSEIQKTNWSKYIDNKNSIAVDVILTKSTFQHSLYTAQLTKDAIVDQFRERTGERPSVDLKSPDLRVVLYINKNKVSVSLDTSGQSLHKRGYRTQTHTVPLNEVLAASIVLFSKWDRSSAFVDGMCGSGTILIEAAMIALDIAPSFFRKKFGFMTWKDYDKVLYTKLRSEVERRRRTTSLSLMGCEVNKKTCMMARDNIENAGLSKFIHVYNKPFEFFEPRRSSGTIVMNPPYNSRQKIQDDPNEKYKMIGDTLKKNYAGFDAYIFTGNLEAAKKIGLRASRRIPLHNGSLDCRLLYFEMYSGSKEVREK